MLHPVLWVCFQIGSADLSGRWWWHCGTEFWRETEAPRSKAVTNTTDCW